jgi:uncharacterized membrane protein (DUF485 family)
MINKINKEWRRSMNATPIRPCNKNQCSQTEPATFSILPCWDFFRDSVLSILQYCKYFIYFQLYWQPTDACFSTWTRQLLEAHIFHDSITCAFILAFGRDNNFVILSLVLLRIANYTYCTGIFLFTDITDVLMQTIKRA